MLASVPFNPCLPQRHRLLTRIILGFQVFRGLSVLNNIFDQAGIVMLVGCQAVRYAAVNTALTVRISAFPSGDQVPFSFPAGFLMDTAPVISQLQRPSTLGTDRCLFTDDQKAASSSLYSACHLGKMTMVK